MRHGFNFYACSFLEFLHRVDVSLRDGQYFFPEQTMQARCVHI